MKKVKALNMRWTVLLVGLGVLSGFIGGYNTKTYQTINSDVKVIKNSKNDYSIELKNAVLDYSEGDETFDLIVTPNEGYNVTPEFDLYASENYRDAYLVGLTKKKAEDLRNGQKEMFPNYKFSPFTWNE